MSKFIKAIYMNTDSEKKVAYSIIKSFECPCCNSKQKPHFIFGTYNNKILYVLCYCESCQKAYIAEYSFYKPTDKYDEFFYIDQFIKAYPNEYKYSNFNESIKTLSPMFVKVYDQALTADSFGLDEIAGMGFRKALEFLVKDYAISLFPDEREHIEKMHLSDTIDKINYQPITDIAKPCIKVLNDETHYFRRFEKVEVANINKLILAIVGILSAKFIASEIVIPTSDDSSTPPTA